MNQPPNVRSSAQLDLEIDIALQFISAVQHLGRYHRLGLTLTDAIAEASASADVVEGPGSNEATDGDAAGWTATQPVLPGQPLVSVSALDRLAGWTSRLADTYNDGEMWPHPEPSDGWPDSL